MTDSIIKSNIKPYVLLVDDEKSLRLGTKRLLESEGYRVESAENGTEGIRLGTENNFDIAIIDMRMPDFDGLEVLKAIKDVYPNTVCFIATAFASYETAIESTRLGAYSYIPKPFTLEELLHQLEQGYKHRLLLLESERLKKEREEKLLEIAYEKSRLNTIINSIGDGVLVINFSEEVVYYNNAVLKNLDIDELSIGDNAIKKLPAEVNDLVYPYLKSDKVIHESLSKQIEIKPDNKLIVEAVCSRIPHPDGTLAGVAIVIRDITELKKIEAVKSQFVSMVAHELKAPVAAVQGFINLLLNDQVALTDEQKNNYLARSEVRLKSLLDLVNDLLDISRMEMKSKQREIEKIDLSEIVESTIQILEIPINKRRLVVSTVIEPDLPQLSADNNEITRVFTNLLSNAIKYNKDEGKIDISISKSKNYFVIKVADTGVGLKPEEKEKLFHEFYRAKNELTRTISGTGLGLTIVKRIVDSYHGKIAIESEFGIGTTFVIQLPININHLIN